MFEQTFVRNGNSTVKVTSVVASFLFQTILMGTAVLVSLSYTGALPVARLSRTPIELPPPPPALTRHSTEPKLAKRVPRQFHYGQLIQPRQIRSHVMQIPDEEMPLAPATVIPGWIPGGVAGTASNGVLDGMVGSFGTPPLSPATVPEKETRKGSQTRIHVGGNVQVAKLITQPKPPYPPLARQARIQGTVRFSAIIGKDGTIQNLQLVSGHPLLVRAAAETVRQWRYRPTLLNNEPVEVVTQIDVNFALSQ
jgi:periplasmic protein TonB